MPRVSIVVPIYNVEGYLDKNLNSLSKQTYQDIEVLCVDDGSTDNSAKVIEKYCSLDKRFIHLSKENGGLSDARNFGLKYVKGEYVMFIDSDDFCELDMVEDCVKHMDEDNLDMFIFAYNQYYLEENRKEFIPLEIKNCVTNLKEMPEILAKTPNAAWNKMYKTSLFVDNGIKYPFGYRHQDLGTTPKLLHLASRIGYDNKAYYNYLIDRPDNITRQIDKKIYHILDMCKEVVDYYKSVNCFDEVEQELNYLVNTNILRSLMKAMKFKDQKFVFAFIDDVFDFKEAYFKKPCRKYNLLERKSHMVYMHRNLCKAYYLYRRKGL